MIKKFPENKFPDSEFVGNVLQSHVIWHIFVFLNGYTFYWLIYDLLFNLEAMEAKASSF